MINGKEFRKELGFTNKTKFKEFLGAKDIVEPNWAVICRRNQRLAEVFKLINEIQTHKSNVNIDAIIDQTTETIKANNILPRLNNHGRAIEDVYYSWLAGYLAEIVFQPLMIEELGLTDLDRNGGDDLTDPKTFKRTGDADLVSHENKVMIDVQAGFTGSRFDIKKHKMEHAMKNPDYKSVVFFIDMVNGSYAIIDLKELVNEEFVPNPRWEGQLCWSVPEELFKEF